MTIKERARRRLAAGIAGALLAASLVVGAVSVAADGETAGQEKRETNQGAESIGVVQDTVLSINSVVTIPAANDGTVAAPAQDLPVIGTDNGRDDRQ